MSVRRSPFCILMITCRPFVSRLTVMDIPAQAKLERDAMNLGRIGPAHLVISKWDFMERFGYENHKTATSPTRVLAAPTSCVTSECGETRDSGAPKPVPPPFPAPQSPAQSPSNAERKPPSRREKCEPSP